MKADWKTIDSVPCSDDLVFWRDDAGAFRGMYGSPQEFFPEGYLDELLKSGETTEDVIENDWFIAVDRYGWALLEGEETPTHWDYMPIEGPEC